MCVWWETVAEMRSRATESVAPHGAEVGEGCGELMEEEDPSERDGVVIWRRSDR